MAPHGRLSWGRVEWRGLSDWTNATPRGCYKGKSQLTNDSAKTKIHKANTAQ
jgi:hypothetical protein